MKQILSTPRLVRPNAKSIEKAVGDVAGPAASVTEIRIEGVRGLVLHVLPTGTATWYVHYDVVEGSRRLRRKQKIGRLDDLPLARATREAARIRVAVCQGADPVGERSRSKTSLSFQELCQQRLQSGDPLRPSTLRDYEHLLKKDILPKIGHLAAKDVTRQDVIKLLDLISERGAQRRADTARAVISSIFSFGLDRGVVTDNPARWLRNRHDYQPRDVIAKRADLNQLRAALDQGSMAMSDTVGLIVHVALLTGARRTEIAAMKKTDLAIDGDEPRLTIPRGRAKNRNIHEIPLSPQALAVVHKALSISGEGPHVFPGRVAGSCISSRSVSKAMERSRLKLGIEDVTLHDLRRTAGTYMSQLGVPRDVRERVLNHGGRRKASVTDSVYNRYEYLAEKRAALELWADAVDAMAKTGSPDIESYHLRLGRLKGTDRVQVR